MRSLVEDIPTLRCLRPLRLPIPELKAGIYPSLGSFRKPQTSAPETSQFRGGILDDPIGLA